MQKLIVIILFLLNTCLVIAKNDNSCISVDVNKNMRCVLDKLDKDLAKHKQDDLIIADDYLLIAEQYERYGSEFLDYTISLEYYTKALKIKKALYGERHTKISYIYSQIASQYYMLDNYIKAIKYYKKSIDSDINKEGLGIFYHYSDLASCYKKINKYDIAIEYYKKAIELDKYNDFLYRGLAEVYNMQKKYVKAIEIYEIILSLRKIKNNNLELQDTYFSLYYAYENLNQYNIAMKYLSKYADSNIDDNGKYRFGGSYKELAEYYYKQKAFQKALHYYKIHKSIYQGLSVSENKKIDKKISDLLSKIN